MAFTVVITSCFFASLQWLFQHQRTHDDADSDTQASDHELAQPVEVLGDSEQCDYEMVEEENEDQNFSALKSILQSPLHESEVVSKEDKKDKLESKNIKGENLEAKEKREGNFLILFTKKGNLQNYPGG